MIPSISHPESSEALDRRLESGAWGLFLIILGLIWLVPAERFPEGTWLIAAGGLMVALNALRFVLDIPVSGSTLFLGAVALILGLAQSLDRNLRLIPVLLILIGAGMIVRPWIAERMRA